MSLTNTLIGQYDHCWRMLENGIGICTEDQWKHVIDDPFFVPCRVAFHIIQSADYYAGVEAADFNWAEFGFDWEEAPTEQFPNKADTIAYLERVKEKVSAFIESKGNETLIGSDEAFSPRFESPFARMLYGLRHSHHHIGQLSLDLQRRGLPEISW